MNNFLLAYDNVIDHCTVTASNSWVATLPLNNVKTADLSEKARSVNDANFTITCNFSTIEDKLIGAVSVLEHNLSSAAKIVVRAYKSTVLVYTSPLLYVWPYLHENDSFWKTFTFTPQVITGTRLANERPAFHHVFPSNVSVDEVQIDIQDSTNPDTYIQLGRVFIGTLVKPDRNVNFGEVSINVIDNSEVQLTRSKSKKFHRLPKQRSASVVWSSINRQNAIGDLFTLQRYSGTTKEILFAEGYPLEQNISGSIIYDSQWFSLTFIGNAAELNPLSYVNIDLYSNGIRIDEVI